MTLVLFVDDEEHLRLAAAQTFELNELSVEIFEMASDLLKHVTRETDAVVVSDIRMPGMDGISLLEAILQIDPDFPVILLTGHGDISMAVDCMKLGAYDFLEKPYSQSHLVDTVSRAQEKRRLTLENRVLRHSLDQQKNVQNQLLGHSKVMDNIRSQIQVLSTLETDILLSGETGVGKSTVARCLHEMSPRGEAPFVHINCAAIPDDMVEIELFGHEVGAFPSASRARYGKFEYARGGTVFLDSIECLSKDTQAKILQSIDSRIITRLGSNDPVELDVRFIAASQSELINLVKNNEFRSDLYYRLSGAELEIPPLRDRKEDISILFTEFVAQSATRHGRDIPNIPHSIYSALLSRDWPGNLHELKKIADRFVLGLDMTLVADLNGGSSDKSLMELLADHEKAIIVSMLAKHNGSLKETYEALKISRKALYEKMQKLGLRREDFRSE